MAAQVLSYLEPWEFSPTMLAVATATLAAYLLGWRRRRRAGKPAGFWGPFAFLTGLVLIYAFLQTYLDYLSQHMFWVHRLQHLVIHHLAPFLIALSAPGEILDAGTPRWLKAWILRPLWTNPISRAAYRTVQQPVVASLLFVGLICFWLTPSIHFDAMLSRSRYDLMNGSMLIDGLLFWWLMVGPEDPRRAVRLGYGTRLAVLLAITIPQTVIGAYITFHQSILYDVYNVCGRAWPISPLVDQQLGGLNTWIPPGMMSAAGAVVIASRWLRAEPELRRTGLSVPPVVTAAPPTKDMTGLPARCAQGMS